MSYPLISVVVPVYKVEQYLDKCLDSVVHQTYRNIEIILVDDGSPDACPKICEQWKLRDERIVVIHKKNGGLSDARNAGLDIAKGKYISFIDSDDWIEHNMIETMYRAIVQWKAQICCCGIINFYEDINKENFVKRDFFIGNAEQTFLRLYNDTIFPVSSCCKLVLTDIYKNIRFPVGKTCEDTMTTYLLVDAAEKIVQIPDLFYHYRIRENSIMTSDFSLSKLDEEEAWRMNYEFIKTHYPKLECCARKFWLEHLSAVLSQIPLKCEKKGAEARKKLRGVLQKNFLFIISQFSLKKIFNFFRVYFFH